MVLNLDASSMYEYSKKKKKIEAQLANLSEYIFRTWCSTPRLSVKERGESLGVIILESCLIETETGIYVDTLINPKDATNQVTKLRD